MRTPPSTLRRRRAGAALTLLATLITTDALAVDAIVLGTCGTGPGSYAQNVGGHLIASGQFGNVTVWDAGASLPSLNMLALYQVVMLQYDCGYANNTTLGDTLASYVDLGGGVVTPSFDFGFPAVQGQFATGGYMAFLPQSPYYANDRTLGWYDSASPIMAGVTSYTSGYFNAMSPTPAPTATVVAQYSDGAAFIAWHAPTGAGRVVSVNDYNVSSGTGRGDFWDTSTNGQLLWANAATFASGIAVVPPCDDLDADGYCSYEDFCDGPGTQDSDGDLVCNGADFCFGPGAYDADADGTCDLADLCVGQDWTGDADGDGICNNLDPTCPSVLVDLGSATGMVIASGNTCGETNDIGGTCAGQAASPEISYRWTAPATGQIIINTIGSDYDTALTVQSAATCGELACDDDAAGNLKSRVYVSVVEDEEYIINADGYASFACGNFEVNLCLDLDFDNACDDGSMCEDSDGDGFCNNVDLCWGEGQYDGDFDGYCDGVDYCVGPGGYDSDYDLVCDWEDSCWGPGRFDQDYDGICDGADTCFGYGADDNDADGYCDYDDYCLGNGRYDTDDDGICDDDDTSCDSEFDSDADGYCDSVDYCWGPGAYDGDFDGWCIEADACVGYGPTDTDTDGVCDYEDYCVGNGRYDSDYDGICDGDDDACPDGDADGVCDVADDCDGPGPFDSDGDLFCDPQDFCWGPGQYDTDFDGSCDEVDLCEGADWSGDSDEDGICNDLDATCPSEMTPLGSALGANIANGNTCEAGNEVGGTCAGGAASDEDSFEWVAPSTGYVIFDTIGSSFDTALTVLNGSSCLQLSCDDDSGGGVTSRVTVWVEEGETYIINADGFGSGSCGDYVLNACSDFDEDGQCDDGGVTCRGVGPVDELEALANADAIFDGAYVNSSFGQSVANIGDFNGDGVDDMAVGAPQSRFGGLRSGAVYVFFGPIEEGGLVSSNADVLIHGTRTRELAGWSIAGVGDQDGDGLDDLLIGSNPDPGSPNIRGKAWLVSGTDSTDLITLDEAAAEMTGLIPRAQFGQAVASAGDINGDGWPDIAVGAPGSAAGVESPGSVHVWFGPVSGQLAAAEADVVLIGEAENDEVGSTILSDIDIDADGLSDLVLGAPREATGGVSAGAVYEVLGSDVQYGGTYFLSDIAAGKLIGDTRMRLGSALANAGDVTSDGIDDYWIGAPYAHVNRGHIYLIRGEESDGDGDGDGGGGIPMRHGVDALFAFGEGGGPVDVDNAAFILIQGADGADLAGVALAGGEDLNADGYNDVVIGASTADGPGGIETGAAWVLTGPFREDMQLDDTVASHYGAGYQDYAGSAVAIGELNGDDVPDVMIGAWRSSAGGVSRGGRVGVVFGGSSVQAWYTDADGDGWGDSSTLVVQCSDPGAGVHRGGDCDDASSAFFPYAIESDCEDPVDYNCDGSVGPVDADGDGVLACAGDCDDGDVATGPAVDELCGNDVDDDCDGGVDDAGAVDAVDYFIDGDYDGYGEALVRSCVEPEFNYALLGGDCYDWLWWINPGEEETCDGWDNDCDGDTDEDGAVGSSPWYTDTDGDGFGEIGSMVMTCWPSFNQAPYSGDCDDFDASVSPFGFEVCDGVDNDCDGANYLGGDVDAVTTSAWTVSNGATFTRFGAAVGVLPDVDGDFVSEVVVSAPGDNTFASHGGAVYVYPGRTHEARFAVGDPWAGSPIAVVYGEYNNIYAGEAVAGGDLDGDGIGDLVIGTPSGHPDGLNQGVVSVFFGPLYGNYTLGAADVTLLGVNPGDRFGAVVRTADVDGDGLDDLLIGAPEARGGGVRRGEAYVVHGSGLWSGYVQDVADAYARGTADNAKLGTSVAYVGGGSPMFVVGAPGAGTPGTSQGEVSIFAGALAGPLTPTTTWSTTRTNEQLGLSVDIGDFDGDGSPDVVAAGAQNRAWVLLAADGISGGDVEADASSTLRGAFGARLSGRVQAMGDLNADGVDDLGVGLPEFDGVATDVGAVAIVYGEYDWQPNVNVTEVEGFGTLAPGGFPTLSAANAGVAEGAVVAGSSEWRLGFAFAGGDVNGDGLADLLMGAPYADSQSGGLLVHYLGQYGLDWVEGAVVAGSEAWVADLDRDGFGEQDGDVQLTCAMHKRQVYDEGTWWEAAVEPGQAVDCDDADGGAYPGHEERALDGRDSDCDGWDSVNNAPVIAGTMPALFTNTVAAPAVTITDADVGTSGETVVATSQMWFVNGVATGETGPTLDGAVWFEKGDVVTLQITADDGRADGFRSVSLFGVVQNSEPVIGAVALTPVAPTDADAVTALISGITDADASDVVFTSACVWERDLGGGNWQSMDVEGEVLSPCLENPFCDAGSTVRVTCQASDGQGLGPAMSSDGVEIIPDNYAPSAQSCTVTRRQDGSLVALGAATDADGDEISWTYRWFNNGTLLAGQVDPVLRAAVQPVGHSITAQCVPADGQGDGLATTSAAVVPSTVPAGGGRCPVELYSPSLAVWTVRDALSGEVFDTGALPGGTDAVTLPYGAWYLEVTEPADELPGATYTWTDTALGEVVATGTLSDGELEARGYFCAGSQTDALIITGANANVFITEIADYLSESRVRYVEIYNGDVATVMLDGWELRTYTNGSVVPTIHSLTGVTIPPGATWIVGDTRGSGLYHGYVGGEPDALSSTITGNGDDVYTLTYTFGGLDYLRDIYGQIGVDGTGTGWEYTDEIIVRDGFVTSRNDTFTPIEWKTTGSPGSPTMGTR